MVVVANLVVVVVRACVQFGGGGGTLRGGDIVKVKYPLVDGDGEEVGDLSLESIKDEEVATVDGVFEGAFGALEGLEVEALMDAMKVYGG
ncbi:hypothetical protein Tco_1229901 [Tanacetum coccineum]